MANRTITDIYFEVGQVIVDAWVYLLRNYKDPRHGYGSLDQSSKLVQSFDYDVTFQERDVETGQFESIGLILFSEEYGEFLDRGRRALTRKVPISALIQFIKKRNLQQKFRRGGRFRSLNSIAFLLQNSIYKHGINARNFIRPGLEAGQEVLEVSLDRDLLDILIAPVAEFYTRQSA